MTQSMIWVEKVKITKLQNLSKYKFSNIRNEKRKREIYLFICLQKRKRVRFDPQISRKSDLMIIITQITYIETQHSKS